MVETIVIVCVALLVVCVALDLLLRRVRFRKADAKAAAINNKYRYKGW